MGFIANIFWISIGFMFWALARSYLRSGPRAAGISLGLIGATAIAAGMFL